MGESRLSIGPGHTVGQRAPAGPGGRRFLCLSGQHRACGTRAAGAESRAPRPAHRRGGRRSGRSQGLRAGRLARHEVHHGGPGVPPGPRRARDSGRTTGCRGPRYPPRDHPRGAGERRLYPTCAPGVLPHHRPAGGTRLRRGGPGLHRDPALGAARCLSPAGSGFDPAAGPRRLRRRERPPGAAYVVRRPRRGLLTGAGSREP